MVGAFLLTIYIIRYILNIGRKSRLLELSIAAYSQIKVAIYLNNINMDTDTKPQADEQPQQSQSQGAFPPRQMVQGSWQCSDCNTEIKELPFEPAPDRPIYCRDCWSKRRDQRKPRFNR